MGENGQDQDRRQGPHGQGLAGASFPHQGRDEAERQQAGGEQVRRVQGTARGQANDRQVRPAPDEQAHARDEQDFAHVRSNLPRYLGPAGLEFFLDSRPEYTSDVQTVVLGGTQALGPRVDLSLASILTFVGVHYDGSGATPGVLEDVDEIASRIYSLEVRLGWKLRRGLSLGLGYRLDAYRDDEEHEPLSYDTDVHTATFDVTVDLDAVRELAK